MKKIFILNQKILFKKKNDFIIDNNLNKEIIGKEKKIY